MKFKFNQNEFEAKFDNKITPNKFIKWENIFNKYLAKLQDINKWNEIETLRLNKLLIENNALEEIKMAEFLNNNANKIIFTVFYEKIIIERILIFFDNTANNNNKKNATDIEAFNNEIIKGIEFNDDNIWFNADINEIEELYNSFRKNIEHRSCY